MNFVNLWVELDFQVFLYYRLVKAVLVSPEDFAFLAFRLFKSQLNKVCCELLKFDLVFWMKARFIVMMFGVIIQKSLN